MAQQPAFDLEQETAALTVEAAEAAAGGDDAMTGDDQRVGVGAAGLADGTRRVFEPFCEFTVGVGTAGRDGGNCLPDTALEVCASRLERQAECETGVGEVGA